MAIHPLDMRAPTPKRRVNRMKVLVHDGIGVWLVARRLNSGEPTWPNDVGITLTLIRSYEQASSRTPRRPPS